MEKFDIYDDNRILTGKVKIKGEKCDILFPCIVLYKE